MLRALLLALVASSAAFFAPGVAMRPAVSRPALAARPMAPLKPALRMMAEETETTSEVVPTEEPCIEDEAIEECILAEWPAGQIKARASSSHSTPSQLAPLIALTTVADLISRLESN